jgi:hypothetical protein
MHREDFADDARDEDWLPVIARRGWVILSKDQFNYLERRAIKNSNGRAFHLVRRDLSGEEQAAIFCKALPQMLRILNRTSPPFMAKIYRDSSIDFINLDK